MTTTTPAARLNRLLAEGARILAVHGSDGGIDVTHDIQGLLAELESSVPAVSAEAPLTRFSPLSSSSDLPSY